MYKYRFLQSILKEKNHSFGALLITGPRRAGKSTLSKKLLELWGYGDLEQRYLSFDTPDVIARFQEDPVIFMRNLKTPCVLDEVQNVPDIFRYIKSDLDKSFGKKIKFILTGSQQFNMMKGVSESLAGRILIKELAPFTQGEINETPVEVMRKKLELLLNSPEKLDLPAQNGNSLYSQILNGGFPNVQEIKTIDERKDWLNSYIQTYIQRDIRQLSQIQDLGLFNRFTSLVAGRSAKIINYSELGKELGMNYKTAQHYLTLLEAGFLWENIQPFYKNTEKRITKSAKGLMLDSALICFFSGIYTEESLGRTPLLGGIVESFAISEIMKLSQSLSLGGQFYFFDQAGKYEVDLIFEVDNKTYLFEFKHSATYQPRYIEGFKKFRDAYPKQKISGAFLVSQNPEINMIDTNTWSIPFDYFWR